MRRGGCRWRRGRDPGMQLLRKVKGWSDSSLLSSMKSLFRAKCVLRRRGRGRGVGGGWVEVAVGDRGRGMAQLRDEKVQGDVLGCWRASERG